MKRAVIVCRVSTAGQEDNYSLDVQEQQCRTACAERGYEVVSVFRDVISGTIRDRPGLNAAVAMVKAGQAEVLMTSVLDRLSREQNHTILIMDEVERAGGTVELALEEIDSTPMGTMILAIKSGMAALEREKIIARVTASLEAKKKAGEPLGSIPLGYRKVDSATVVVDETTAPLVQHIFQLYAEGLTLRGLTKRLESEGYRTPRGKLHWSTSGLCRIIENPRYRGAWPGNQWKVVPRKGQKPLYRMQPESEWLWTDGPAIIDPELWFKANRLRTTARANSPKSAGTPESFLLRTGYVWCGLCGNKLHGITQRNGQRSPAYVCGHRSVVSTSCKGATIAAYLLDDAVWDIVKSLLSDPAVLSEWLDHQTDTDNMAHDIVAARQTVARLEADMNKAAERYSSAPEAILPQLSAQIETLSQRLEVARTDLQLAEDAMADQSQKEATRERLSEVASFEAEALDRLDYPAKRQLIHDLGVKATVWPASHEIRWTVQVNTEVAWAGPVALQPGYYNLFDGKVPFAASSVAETCALLSATPRQ